MSPMNYEMKGVRSQQSTMFHNFSMGWLRDVENGIMFSRFT